jgi:hypothetical protein
VTAARICHEGEQEAIRDMAALRAEGRPLRAIAAEMQAKAIRCHVGVQSVLRAREA